MAEALWTLLELELNIRYPVAFEGQGRQKRTAMDGGIFRVRCRADPTGKCFVGCHAFPGIGLDFFQLLHLGITHINC